MTTHRFRVGQQVDLLPSTRRSSSAGSYTIVGIRPTESDGPTYRLKGADESYERIVAERDLSDAFSS
jgi:hypothetical protein